MRIRGLLIAALTLSTIAASGVRNFFPGYVLDRCELVRFADSSFTVCVVSDVAGPGQRKFSVRVHDPTKLDHDTREHAQLLPAVAIKTDAGEYASYLAFSVLPVSEEDALIFVPIVSGNPDTYTDGRAVLFHLDVKTRKLVKVWDAPRCGTGCDHQGLSLSYRKNEAEKKVLIEQRANKKTRTIELKWDGKRLITSK